MAQADIVPNLSYEVAVAQDKRDDATHYEQFLQAGNEPTLPGR